MIYLTCALWREGVEGCPVCGEVGEFACVCVPCRCLWLCLGPWKMSALNFMILFGPVINFGPKHTQAARLPLAHTHRPTPSCSLSLACCASYARTTNKCQSSKSNNNTFQKKNPKHTHRRKTHIRMNWQKSASGFSFTLTWHLPPCTLDTAWPKIFHIEENLENWPGTRRRSSWQCKQRKTPKKSSCLCVFCSGNFVRSLWATSCVCVWEGEEVCVCVCGAWA